uniref:Uncharacterized protein n=1 Tax=Romanomermis culicivorax TaxID=13658 RepID=A0A915L7Y7_ROMCU
NLIPIFVVKDYAKYTDFDLSRHQKSTLKGENKFSFDVTFTFIKYCPKPKQNEDQSTLIGMQAIMGEINVYDVAVDGVAKIYTSRRDVLSKCFWQGISFPCNTPDDPVMFSDVLTDDEHLKTWALAGRTTYGREQTSKAM